MGEEPQRIGHLGIDPGLSGGIALLIGNPPECYVWKMPETEADIAALFRRIAPRVCFALIESVHSMPGQGVASTFKFGRSYGFLRAMLFANQISFNEITPQKWQKAMGCLSKGDKRITKAKAQQLFPFAKVTHHTADALLIAEYCRENCLGFFSESVWNAL